MAVVVSSEASVPPDGDVRPNLDARLPADPEARGGFVMREPTPVQLALADALVAAMPGTTLHWDGMSGGPRWIAAAPGGTLSGPAVGDAESVARDFLRSRSELFGLSSRDIDRLEVTGSVPAAHGGRHVHFKQTVAGIDVLDGRVNVNLRSDGAVLSVGSRLYAGAGIRFAASIDPGEATRLAIVDVYPDASFTALEMSSEPDGERLTVFDGAGFGFPPRARLVLFPLGDTMRLGWEVRAAEPTLFTNYRLVVDAIDGDLLYRENLTAYADARYLNANQPDPETEEIAPAQHVLATIPSMTAESPNGWIAGSGTTLSGNNAVSHLGFWSDPGLADPGAVYDFPYNTPRSALVNAWWWANEAHDRFYALGFNEEAGNFQEDNLGNPGLSGDAMEVTVYTAGPRGNAFYSYLTPADGALSTINFHWMNCRFCADHDGYPEFPTRERCTAFMRDVVTHEYTHGLIHRLVGGPDAAECFGGVQSDALNEGWADLFAASFYGSPAIFPHWVEGRGVNRDLRNDLTYADFCSVGDTGCQEHADGLIWGGTLWDLRESMRALDPANGLEEFHGLIVEALKRTPCHPSYIDARAAILDADTAKYGSTHHQMIENVFASRGMGESASTADENDTAPVADFTVPAAHVCVPPVMPTGLSATADGSNAIRLDYTATGAAAVEIWREDLDIPFDRPRRIGFTDNTVTYTDTTVQGGKSYRYHVVSLGGGGLTCASPPSGTADASATGTCEAYPIFDPQPEVVDGDPGCELTLNWTAATPGCAGEPVVYNVYRAPTPGFEPSDRLLVARTTSTSLQDTPPETVEHPIFRDTGNTYYYLVLAQHGTLEDPPDHRDRGTSQILRWVPGVPTLGRTLAHSWDFESGPQGWTADVTADPVGGWVRVSPSPTLYGAALWAPDEAAGGAGSAWVTGDAGGPASVTANDCDAATFLTSPVWDGSAGATLLSFDYWANLQGSFGGGLDLRIDNGADMVTVRTAGLLTPQSFETAGRHGWQRAEIDLADFVTPTSTMSVTFVSECHQQLLAEFGVDNVRVENATKCARSGLRLQGVTVDDSPAGWGNGNGVLEPGETARLLVTLANDGSGTAFSPDGRLSSGTPRLLVHEPSDQFPDVVPAATAVSSGAGFTVTTPAEADCPETVTLDFEFTDAAGTTSHASWSPEFGRPVTETIFEDTFETDKGWSVFGDSGRGRFQRGDPVGTTDGASQANPEDDSPNDPGGQCYVTENSLPGLGANVADVDVPVTEWPRLRSPLLDFTGYKRARLDFDLWLYDNSGGDPAQDTAEYRIRVNTNVQPHLTITEIEDPTAGWSTVSRDLSFLVPMTSDILFNFLAYDRNPDNIVEVGVDNVLVEGERQVCDPLSAVNPPNGVGDTLRVDKVGGDVEISWNPAPADATHDAAAYYELYVSAAPASGFTVVDTATVTAVMRASGTTSEFYKTSSINPAGSSGDEPAP
jgi:hypothetical protein